MKKARLMLTAIGLLSVVGGALALKAHRVTGNFVCSTVYNGPTSLCNIVATTNLNIPGPFNDLFCATDGGPCTRNLIVKKTI